MVMVMVVVVGGEGKSRRGVFWWSNNFEWVL